MNWFRSTIVLTACMCFSLATPAVEAEDGLKKIKGALQDGWEQVIEIPASTNRSGEVRYRSAKVRLWVEQGWLSVRRTDADGEIEWQVALAQPLKDTVPVVHVHARTVGVDLSYGNYFIRE